MAGRDEVSGGDLNSGNKIPPEYWSLEVVLHSKHSATEACIWVPAKALSWELGDVGSSIHASSPEYLSVPWLRTALGFRFLICRRWVRHGV